jgi:hypothetical protein
MPCDAFNAYITWKDFLSPFLRVTDTPVSLEKTACLRFYVLLTRPYHLKRLPVSVFTCYWHTPILLEKTACVHFLCVTNTLLCDLKRLPVSVFTCYWHSYITWKDCLSPFLRVTHVKCVHFGGKLCVVNLQFYRVNFISICICSICNPYFTWRSRRPSLNLWKMPDLVVTMKSTIL